MKKTHFFGDGKMEEVQTEWRDFYFLWNQVPLIQPLIRLIFDYYYSDDVHGSIGLKGCSGTCCGSTGPISHKLLSLRTLRVNNNQHVKVVFYNKKPQSRNHSLQFNNYVKYKRHY